MNKKTKRWKKFLKEPGILEMKSAMTKDLLEEFNKMLVQQKK